MDLLHSLVLGGYAFAAGGYIFTFAIYRWLRGDLRTLEMNHLSHIKAEVDELREEIRQACKIEECPIRKLPSRN